MALSPIVMCSLSDAMSLAGQQQHLIFLRLQAVPANGLTVRKEASRRLQYDVPK